MKSVSKMVLRALKDDVASLLLTDDDRQKHKTKKSMLTRLWQTRWHCGSADNNELAWLETRALLSDKRNAMLVRQWTRFNVERARHADDFARRFRAALCDYFGRAFVFLFAMAHADVLWCRVSVGHRAHLPDLVALKTVSYVGVPATRDVNAAVITCRGYMRRYLIEALAFALHARDVVDTQRVATNPFELFAATTPTATATSANAAAVTTAANQTVTVALASGIHVTFTGRAINDGLAQLSNR
jgi:hypothetical protein